MIKGNLLKSMVILFLLLPVAFLGCGGGGGGDAAAPVPSPSIQVRPSVSYDFGTVTPGNVPAPLEVEIKNNGSATLNVSSIALLDDTLFHLDLTLGSNPCGDTPPWSIAPGGSCNAEVEFDPKADGSFGTTLRIISNATNASTLGLNLLGAQAPILGLNVRINQVESDEAFCPNPGSEVTAYVSVTDQGNYPVVGLTADDFTITEVGGVNKVHPDAISNVTNTSLSVSLVMDYSGSITDIKDAVDDMQEAVSDFVDDPRFMAGDEAEIIKFADDWNVVQSWQPGTVAGKILLKAAVNAAYYNGRETDLYDAVYEAIDRTAAKSKDRRAVIVVSDGWNDASDYNLLEVIDHANDKGVPIFVVGLGEDEDIYLHGLEIMADRTGGQLYESTTTDNLRTIYQQLADLLFEDQYILPYSSGLGAVPNNLTIEATYSPTIKGENDPPKKITPCP